MHSPTCDQQSVETHFAVGCTLLLADFTVRHNSPHSKECQVDWHNSLLGPHFPPMVHVLNVMAHE